MHGAAYESTFFVFQQNSAPSHCAKYAVALLDQETPKSHPLSGRTLTRRTLNGAVSLTTQRTQRTVLRCVRCVVKETAPKTLCGVCFRCESVIILDADNWNDASTSNGRQRLHTRLRSCWRRTFWAHAVIEMMCCDTSITVNRVCRYSVNRRNVHLIIALTAHIGTSNLPRTHFRWSGHFRHSFVNGLFRDNSTNFHWHRFISAPWFSSETLALYKSLT